MKMVVESLNFCLQTTRPSKAIGYKTAGLTGHEETSSYENTIYSNFYWQKI